MASPSSIPPRRSLKTDPANKPTSDVSLDSPHWVDQLPVAKVSGLGSLLGSTNLYVNGSTGVDATAQRGNGIAWATLGAAIAKALPGDAIVVQSCGNTGNAPSLSGVVTVPTGVAIRGDGSDNARVNVTNAASLVYAAGTTCKIEGVSFYGPVAATAIAGALISLNQASAVSIKNCRFANFNQTAINAVGVSHTLIQGNTFDHVGGAFLGDDIPNAYNTDFVFDGNTSEWTLSGTYIFHSPSSYNAVSNGDTIPSALAFSRTFRITNNVARYAGFGNQAGNGVLAFEVWHGWTGGVIANNVAEDSYFGFSIDRTTNTLVSNNRAQHCTFQFEFNTCTNITAEDNIADTRPSAGSPFAGTSVNSIVIFDGNCTDCTWKGGAIVGGYVHFYGSGVRNCSVTGAQIKSAFVYVQHPTGNCEVTGNRFSKEVSLPRANFWLLIDTSGDANGPSTIPRLAFSRNTLTDGVNQNGIEFLYANTGTITRFEIENNVSDLVSSGTAYYHYGVDPTITSHSFRGNYTPAGNGPFPNTDDTIAQTDDPRFDAIVPDQIEPAGIVAGVTDESTYIQAQLMAAAAKGKAVVRMEARQYAISPGVIQIPNNVTLDFGGGSASTGRQVISYGAGQPATSATAGGQFVMLGGANGKDTDPAYIEFTGNRSALVNASFYDPDNTSNLSTPVAKPFAVRTGVYGCTVARIELINCYRGIDVRGGRTVVRDISGNPLSLGVRVDTAYDVPRLDEIHFGDSFVRGTPLAAWFAANSMAFLFLDNDFIMATRLFSYAYRTGLQLDASPVSGRPAGQQGTYGVLSDSGFDGCYYGVLDKCTQVVGDGMKLANCKYTPFGYDHTARGYLALNTKTGLTMLQGGGFWGDGDARFEIAGGVVAVRDTDSTGVTLYGGLVSGDCAVVIAGNRFNNKGSIKTILVTSAGSSGRIGENVFGDNTNAAGEVSNASAKIIVAADNADRLSPLQNNVVALSGAPNPPLNAASFGNRYLCIDAATSANYPVPLPPVANNAGKSIEVAVATNMTKLVTLDAGSGVAIDGQQTRIMQAGECATLFCNGAGWIKTGGISIPMSVKMQRRGGNQTAAANAYTQALLDTGISGRSDMVDAANGRAAILRPGTYAANVFAYQSGGSNGVAVGVSQNGVGNTTDASNGYTVAAANAGTGATNTFVCATGDYLVLFYYAFSTNATMLSGSIGSRPQIVVTEIPAW